MDPVRDALHRFHVPSAPAGLVHREPTQLLGYRSLVISKEAAPVQCKPGPRASLPIPFSRGGHAFTNRACTTPDKAQRTNTGTRDRSKIERQPRKI